MEHYDRSYRTRDYGHGRGYDRDYGWRGREGAAGRWGGRDYGHEYRRRLQTDAGDPFNDRARGTPIRAMHGSWEENHPYGRDYDHAPGGYQGGYQGYQGGYRGGYQGGYRGGHGGGRSAFGGDAAERGWGRARGGRTRTGGYDADFGSRGGTSGRAPFDRERPGFGYDDDRYGGDRFGAGRGREHPEHRRWW